MFTAKIEGADKVLIALKNIKQELREEVGLELENASHEITAIAKYNAPKDEGFLQNKISAKEVSQIEHEVVAQDKKAAWLEFGTKKKVQIPAELADVAAKFRGQGSGVDAKKSIFDWCKRKGLPEEAWYPIYREIVTNGIKPHPYFFPAFNEVKPKLIQRIRNILNG
jgi:HK97 gp10 family phage protein